MAWLTSLLNKPETIEDEREASAEDAAVADENGAQPPPIADGPQLAILAPDIAGISSFGLRFFADAATAAAEIEQLPPEMRRGTHAFWALHDEPIVGPDDHCEALVLIRASQDSSVVYAVSFVDMESAWSFARFEAKRGLDVSDLTILWAAFVTVREELDGVSILPAAAPATKANATTSEQSAAVLEPTEPARRDEPTISASTAAVEAPDPPKPAETETARRGAERREAEEATRIAEQAQDELREARAAADAARARAESETRLLHEAERRLEEQQAAADAASSRDLAEARNSSAAEVGTLTEDVLEEPAARGTIFAHASATETEEGTEAPTLDAFDIADEVARLLENRRWDKREEPFHGFDSPPGKF